MIVRNWLEEPHASFMRFPYALPPMGTLVATPVCSTAPNIFPMACQDVEMTLGTFNSYTESLCTTLWW